ncbi:hypothetical protein ABIA30_004278 [Mycobacterium sp. MAA66]|uniref:hypothetical protein n=1 Tax=Mycobacterium sp. MAA66 TaxID=3156297 RepID=UPI003512B0AA
MPDQDTQSGGGDKMDDVTRHTAQDATGFVPPYPYRAADDQTAIAADDVPPPPPNLSAAPYLGTYARGPQ